MQELQDVENNGSEKMNKDHKELGQHLLSMLCTQPRLVEKATNTNGWYPSVLLFDFSIFLVVNLWGCLTPTENG